MHNQPETTLVELIRFNNWANAKVLAACQAFIPEHLAAAAPGTYGSILDTLAHIIRAEADYIGRLTGSSPQPPFRWEDQPGLDALRAYADQVAGVLLETILRIPPDQMVHEEDDEGSIDYKARLLFIQVIDHGIEHRTNVTTILSGLDLPVPEVDGWSYLFSHPETFALKETFRDHPDADHQP